MSHLLHDKRLYQQLFIAALRHLYQAQNYQDMENDLMMMNSLFSHQDYLLLKEDIFKKIAKNNNITRILCDPISDSF